MADILWTWPVAWVEQVHDGDTVRLRIDNGFGSRAVEWVRLQDVWAAELNEPGGPEAALELQHWFEVHATLDGRVSVTTYRTPSPVEIRLRQSFTRYIGTVTSVDGVFNLNDHMRAWLTANPASRDRHAPRRG